MNELKPYLIERLKERSTWIGLTAFLTSVHYQYTSIVLDDAIPFLIAFCGLACVFTKDGAKDVPPTT